MESLPVKRLTREMIKAATGPESDIVQYSSPDGTDAFIYQLPTEDSTFDITSTGVGLEHNPSLSTTGPSILRYGREPELSEQDASEAASSEKKDDDATNIDAEAEMHEEIELRGSPPDTRDGLYADASQEEQLDVAERASSLPNIFEAKPLPDELPRNSLPLAGQLTFRTPITLKEKSYLVRDSSETSQSAGSSQKKTASDEPGPSRTSSMSQSLPASLAETAPYTPNLAFISKSIASEGTASIMSKEDSFRSNDGSGLQDDLTTNSFEVPPMPDLSSKLSNQNSQGVQEYKTSAMKQFQFPLPDLTEDSQEDASTTNLRMLGSKPPGFRTGGPRVTRRDHRFPGRALRHPDLPDSYLPKRLIEIGHIPSFNFSRVDLTTSLNRALGLRSSRSLEEVSKRRSRGMSTLSVNDHPELSFLHRSRYRSFFSDEWEDDDEASNDSGDDEVSGTQHLSAKEDELLNELDRLSIPSVNALTVRLSELLPAIKMSSSFMDLVQASNEDSVQPFEDQQGSVEGTATLEAKRVSLITTVTSGTVARARRSLAASGISTTIRETGYLRLMKELPPLPDDESGFVDRLNSTAPSARAKPFVAQEKEVSSILESKNSNGEGNITEREVEATEASEQPTDSQKGPILESYLTIPKLELKPLKTQISTDLIARELRIATNENLEHSSRKTSLQSKSIREAISSVSLSAQDTIRIARSMSTGPRAQADLIPQVERPSVTQQPSNAKRGIIGSIKRKIGKKISSDQQEVSISPSFLHPEERVTIPGDRYPTSSLPLPVEVNLEETRSFFSDSSGSNGRPNVTTIRQRLSRFKPPPKRSVSRAISFDVDPGLDHGSRFLHGDARDSFSHPEAESLR